jgi:deazaflavin-dependent oxidoreductase (nitroreductase family)
MEVRSIRGIVGDPDLLADPAVSRALRRAFKRLNRAMVLGWRLGLGRWFSVFPRVTGRVLVLTHRGRRSGLLRRTPLNYAPEDDGVLCLAGFGSASDWYRNVRADPRVEIWTPEGWWEGVAEDCSGDPDRLALLRRVLVSSGFAAHAFGVPASLPDDRLARVTRDYRLVRIRTTDARTGPGGPGDLAWVWPVATAALAIRLARRHPV